MWLCPVLSLLRFFLIYPCVLKGDVTLFDWKSYYTRYATPLIKIAKQLDKKLKILGFESGDLGSHSWRKGVFIMVADVCTVYPPIFALCIWTVWVLCGVKDKCSFWEKFGDWYIGLCASCLDKWKREFAVSPPYFDFTELCEIENLDCKRQIYPCLETLIPGYTSISAETNLLKMCCFA